MLDSNYLAGGFLNCLVHNSKAATCRPISVNGFVRDEATGGGGDTYDRAPLALGSGLQCLLPGSWPC